MIRFRLPPAIRSHPVAPAGTALTRRPGTVSPRIGRTRPVALPEA